MIFGAAVTEDFHWATNLTTATNVPQEGAAPQCLTVVRLKLGRPESTSLRPQPVLPPQVLGVCDEGAVAGGGEVALLTEREITRHFKVTSRRAGSPSRFLPCPRGSTAC